MLTKEHKKCFAYYDCVLCPNCQVLSYSTTNREGYREYKSKADICRNCPDLERCTASADCVKTVGVHLWKGYIEQAEDIRHSDLGKKTYEMRSQTIERVFADAKEKHAIRYTYYRGLKPVTNWVKLKFASVNLKKLALWLCFFLRFFVHLHPSMQRTCLSFA